MREQGDWRRFFFPSFWTLQSGAGGKDGDGVGSALTAGLSQSNMHVSSPQALMFWVVDNFLMRKGRTKAKLEERGANQDSRNGSKVRYRRAASHEESESEVGPGPRAVPRPEEVFGLCLHLVFSAPARGRKKRLVASIQQGRMWWPLACPQQGGRAPGGLVQLAPHSPDLRRWRKTGKGGAAVFGEVGKDCHGPDR